MQMIGKSERERGLIMYLVSIIHLSIKPLIVLSELFHGGTVLL